MLILSKKHNGISVIDCWYAQHALRQNGIVRYNESHKPIGRHPEEYVTLISDLTETEDQLLEKLSQNCRYKVRRAPREGIVCKWKFGQDITEQDIMRLCEFLEQFWASKNISFEKEKCRALVTQYAQADAFAISAAYREDKLLVYHTYVVEERRARLFHSASQYRTDESVTTNMIGFANRYLHFQDMLYFKGLGKKEYDWGGAGTGEDVRQITEFKESFGGRKAVFYNGEEARGAGARLYRALTGLIGKMLK